MCGINGFTFADEALINRMNDCVKHRGPDGSGVFVDPQISLGHARLAILDLTSAGAQPMSSPDKTVTIVFNGEIYNFQELREDLKKKGYAFHSGTDTEVIIHAYAAWGIDCVKQFNGIFAFALWDKRQEKLFLVRDHVGVKPLYYFQDPSTGSGPVNLIFSSEIKAILAHMAPRQLNLDALNLYFRALYVPAPLTMFQNIFKLEPAHYLSYHQGIVEKVRYWSPGTTPTIPSKADAKEQIAGLLKDSVKRQMISERPVGVFLSGGIDSTAVLGMARENTVHTLKTFSVGFDVAPEKFNADLALARKTSQLLGTDHQELIVTGQDCARYLPEVIYHMDEPVANGTQVATYLLSKFARQHIVVALGGDGGDELFGGYERYRLSQLVSFYQRLPALTRSLVSSLSSVLPKNFRQEVGKMDIPAGARRYASFLFQKEEDIGHFLSGEANRLRITTDFFQNQYFSSPTRDPENDLMWADLQSWLPDESLIRSDKLSMAFALEQRVPILDYRLVELSRRIPSSLKLQGNTKGLFREAVSPYLPEHILREPKRGWTTPASHWLRTDLEPLMRTVLDPAYNPGVSDLFRFDEINHLYEEHKAVRAYHMNLLWAFLTFQLWYHRFLYA